MQNKRKMGVDFGDVRIGIALSDELSIIASPYEVYKRRNLDADLLYFKTLVAEKNVDTIVMGLPYNMDGSEGPRAKKTRQFAKFLKRDTGVSVVFMDERLTSFEAEELLKNSGVKREKWKELVDKISAQIILENYLKGNK